MIALKVKPPQQKQENQYAPQSETTTTETGKPLAPIA